MPAETSLRCAVCDATGTLATPDHTRWFCRTDFPPGIAEFDRLLQEMLAMRAHTDAAIRAKEEGRLGEFYFGHLIDPPRPSVFRRFWRWWGRVNVFGISPDEWERRR